jgi:hypothetical protein
MNNSSKKSPMPFGVDLIHFIYLVIGIFGSIPLLIALVGIKFIGWSAWSYFAFIMTCVWIIIIGFYKRKSWLWELILVFASFSFLKSVLCVVAFNAQTEAHLALEFIQILLGIFFGYQIVIFPRKETRNYFKKKGTVFIT